LNQNDLIEPTDEKVDSAQSTIDTPDVTEITTDSNSPVSKPFFTPKTVIIVLAVLIVVMPLLGIGVAKFTIPWIQQMKNSDELSQVADRKGNMVVANNKLETFHGQIIESTNTEQKSLVRGNDGKDSAVFIFTNDKQTDNKKILDIYIDFDSPKSRDFVLLNQTSFKRMVENGVIELRVHPVPTGNAMSMYAAETLAESVVTSPNTTWDLMLALLKKSATLNTTKSDEVIKAVVETAQSVNVQDVDEKSISNGTFASWILAVGDDTHLKTGYYPPIAYLNNTSVNPDKVNLNDSPAFQDYILNN
jgi:hypothetical protein